MSGSYLIVGGSSGIGAALVSRMSKDKHDIISLSRTKGTLPKMPNVDFYSCDVSDNSVDLPSFDIPLAGVAYFPGTVNLKPFQSITEEDYRRDWEINFLGATRLINQYLSNLKKNGDASILLMSTVGVQQGMAYHASIASAKGAVEGLTLALAAELAPRIRVNAIAPSLTMTPLTHHLVDNEKKIQNVANRHPLGRLGSPDDIAEVGNFLLSGKSSWITGQIFHIDGGLSTVRQF